MPPSSRHSPLDTTALTQAFTTYYVFIRMSNTLPVRNHYTGRYTHLNIP